MTRRLAVCRFFEPEFRAAMEAERLGGIALAPFQGPCDDRSGARPAPDMPVLAGRCARVPGSLARYDTCFGFLLGEELANRFLSQGLHLLTPTALRAWHENARIWGFAPETARAFFQESITGFRVVDCGVVAIAEEDRASLEAYAGVPVDIWPASLDHLRLWLRLNLADSSPARSDPGKTDPGRPDPWRLSDFAMAYDLIGSLLARERETDVGQGIAELFVALCAPAAVSLRVQGAPGIEAWACRIPEGLASEAERQALGTALVANAPAGPDGFTLSLPGDGAPIAQLWVGGVALPERRGHYLQLGTMLAPVLGLVLADSRRRGLLVAREVEERTRRDHALLAALVGSSHDAIVSQNLEGVITTWNRGATQVFGYTAEEAIGRRIDRLIPLERLSEAHEVVQRLLRGETILPFETVRIRKDGSRIDVSVAISPIRDRDGTVIGASRITRDISELKRAEVRILRLNEELEQRVRERTAQLEATNRALVASNQELESFSYSVSHDLRGPLRALNGFSAILQDEFAAILGDEGRQHLERVRGASRKMSQLIDDLLALSRIGRGDLVPVPLDLGHMAEEVLAELAQADPGRKVRTTIAARLAAQGDRRLVKIALENLLGNAWKYTRLAADPYIEVAGEEEGGERVFVIRDNGAGFDMQYAGKLFSPFQRLHADPRYEGTGIGLATVQRIIRRHGGRIWAEAEPGRGATFRFTLPGFPVS